MKQNIRIVAAYSLIHFAVDFSCIAILTGIVLPAVSGRNELILCVLLYNAFAFAFQLPIGLLGDFLNKNALLSALGCIMVAFSWLIPNIAAVCIVAGIGNACFHVGGGIDVLNISNRKAAFPGIFVAPGAMGVFLGAMVVNKGFNKFYLIAILMILCAAVLCFLFSAVKNKYNIQNTRPSLELKINGKTLAMAACLVATIFLRSYMGTILKYSFKTDILMGTLFVVCIVLGKAFGGIIGDKFGWLKTSMITLLAAAILFAFSFKSTAAAMIAILLFNMTMPITLTALANSLKLGKGFAFGLTTFALFLGVIPAAFGLKSCFFTVFGLVVITVISAGILALGLKLYSAHSVKSHD